ncbi:cupin domain-containing protein [Deinococcus sp. Arct2-2]|uniref:cupin domain-containing protein n=1 Tax=Deinococcus sp. Arct2-2 TaxID=2568653 RepID=UPI0010A58C91|nr:cupin domain-containing protein [Deinococcus sp. Arct2-2]THF68384.1 cupin domain-containing protein [Deinococcus sp. Arct2-2]
MTNDTPAALSPLPGAEGFNHGSNTAPAYRWLDILWIVLPGAQDTGGRFSLMEEWLSQGSGPGPHKHTWSDETYYILDGQITFLVGDETKVARTGDFLMVPRGTRHAFRVDSETARFLNGYTPASLEAAVIEMAMPAPARILPPKNATLNPLMTPEQL